MVKVQKIEVSEFNLIKELDNKKNKDMQECLKYTKNIDIRKLLPKKSKITVSFELKETNSDFANAIRRCLINEIETLSFTYNEYDDKFVDITDPFILSDFIKKQIELLPINQEFDYENLNIILFKENKTDEIIDVLSGDISIHKKDSKESINIENIIEKNIILCR